MILHYLKIYFRNIRKYKAQSLAGILGLTFGLGCFVHAFYWMRYETSYDSFYPNAAHIYRVYSVEKQSGKVNVMVPGILSRELHEHFSVVEYPTGFVPDKIDFRIGVMPDIRLHTLSVDSSFFQVFPQEIIQGNTKHPLQLRHNMVLTETVAIRLFGDVEKAIGQQITNLWSEDYGPCTVTAVIKDPPPNTNLPFEALLNYPVVQNVAMSGMHEAEQWHLFNNEMYARFHPNANVSELAEQLRDFTSQIDANTDIELRILPISDIRYHLNADLPFTLNFIRLLTAAGVLLLCCALFNFLNWHIDLFCQRIHEFRQRAVHGAKPQQLTMQMIFEMTFGITLSLAFTFCFVLFLRPMFSGLLDIAMPVSKLIYLFVVCGIAVLVLMLFTGMILFGWLSRSFIRHLSKRKNIGQSVLRRIAVSLQLAASLVFIVASLVVMMQMRFLNHKDLGFDHKGIIQLSCQQESLFLHREALMNELAAIPQIESITSTAFEPQHNANWMGTSLMNSEVEWTGKSPSEKPVFQHVFTDSQFAETFRLDMKTGKWWEKGERRKVVLNEEAVRVMGLSEPVGATICLSIALTSMGMRCQEYEVVGVVKDFHMLSLRNRIYPAIYSEMMSDKWYIRVVPGLEQDAMRKIAAILPNIDSGLADTRLTPLGELYDHLNSSEQAGLKLFSVLATVSLLISLFGIYTIAVTATQHRRKEIAIRKVFGAKVSEIVWMFFREYTIQVITTGVIGLPLATYAMRIWLQGYAYRTNIPWWLLTEVITGIVAVVLLTVLGQVLKAANSNPAEVVKSE
ncbi:MAG: ABC transporter permease [Tannerellaceae bacterium]|jgi:putative ABC transport system permease protein|nr:ABC transporter permease [Tannerellaceae bacterium]